MCLNRVEPRAGTGRIVLSKDSLRVLLLLVSSDCLADAGVFLDQALKKLGLNFHERCDMITYWLAELLARPFNVIYFVDQQHYEKAARLDISPSPDVTIRVFMVFR